MTISTDVEARAKLIDTLITSIGVYPEQRLGQIISNAVPARVDLYYVSDADLIEHLKRYYGA